MRKVEGFYCVINAQVGGNRGPDRKLLTKLTNCEDHAKHILRSRCDPRSGTVLFAVKIEKVVQFEPHPIIIERPTLRELEDYFG